MKDEKTKVLEKAIDTFGTDMQLNVAVEELAELTKEICKYKRGADNLLHIIEEMADCYIMLEQMKIIFALGSTVIADAASRKIERLERRLEEAEKGGAE
jgi:NTP pyrophosphatase (non-canonical NTP hydrolase)